MGQFLAQVVEQTRAEGTLARYYAAAVKPGDPVGQVVLVRATKWIYAYTPVRFSPGWKNYLGGELFDREAAAKIEAAEIISAYNGQALHIFRRARRLGYKGLILESATAHVNHVMRQQEKAVRAYGIEAGWLNEAQRRKTLREYEVADIIYAASQHARDTFLAEGIPAHKLQLRHFQADARFTPPTRRPDDGVFRIVYVGALSVMKGAPALLDAFARFAHPHAELTIVGGWGTRGMRHYMEERLRSDPRIRVAPGDPLPYLQRADVFVHPSFTDSLGLAPLEALACGVPVIVTEDTGMKEHIRDGVNGYVVPTGSAKAILAHLEALIRLEPLHNASDKSRSLRAPI